MRTQSLSFRLLISEGLVLAVFFTLVAVILEQGFRESAEQALKDRLQVQVYALLSAAKLSDAGDLAMPASLYEPRFAIPGAGLYAFIHQPPQQPLWRSQSALGLDPIALPPQLPLGESKFVAIQHNRYALHTHVLLKNAHGAERSFIFTVTEDAQFVSSKIAHLQETLRTSLLFIGIMLVAIQFTLLRWSLKPLRLIVQDLKAVETGDKTHLDGLYPSELAGLAGSLNAFIAHEQALLKRYRNDLLALAHSIKNPLAILYGCVDACSGKQETVHEQLEKMNRIVDYQLKKAAAKGKYNALKTVDIANVITKVTDSLNKVYMDKNVRTTLNMPEHCPVYCEEGDLYEIVGNLMDNAYKWCHQRVTVSIQLNQRTNRRDFSALLLVEDDGDGIPVGKFNDILKPGIRADENVAGHGVGMAVVNELTGFLGGKLEGGKSLALGGMKWRVYLP